MSDARAGSSGTRRIEPRSVVTRWLGSGLLALAVGVATAAAGCTPAPEVETAVPAGTSLVAALDDPVSTGAVSVGDEVGLTIAEPVPLEGNLELPAGTTVKAEVIEASGGPAGTGTPELTLRFTHLEVNGEEYAIEAEPLEVSGQAGADEPRPMVSDTAPTDTMQGDTTRAGPVPEVISTGAMVPVEDDQIVLRAGQKVEIRLAAAARVKVPRDTTTLGSGL